MKVEIKDVEKIKNIQGVPDNEKETHINFLHSSDNCVLYTRDNSQVTKLKKCLKDNPNEYKCFAQIESDGSVVSYEFEFPKKYITFRKRNKESNLSEEQRMEIAKRFRKNTIENNV